MVWLVSLVTVIHVTACVILILVILLQHGSKADLGVFSGASTQTAFGGVGPASTLQKITAGAAVIFMATCLFLSIYSGRPTREKSPVLEKLPGAPTPAPKPVAPPTEQKAPTPAQPQGGAPPQEQGTTPQQQGTAPTGAPSGKKD